MNININIQDVYYKKYIKYKKKYLQLKQNGGFVQSIANSVINAIGSEIIKSVYITDPVMARIYDRSFTLNDIHFDSLKPMETYITTQLLKHLKDFYEKTLKTKYLKENINVKEETYNTNKKLNDEKYINSVFINFQTNLIDKIVRIINIYKNKTKLNTTSEVKYHKKKVEIEINNYIDTKLKEIPNYNQFRILINKYFDNINTYIHKHYYYKKK